MIINEEKLKELLLSYKDNNLTDTQMLNYIVEEFGREAFYKGREIKEISTSGEKAAIFKIPTFNEYLRILAKESKN
jgi:hypothetical protein